MLVGLIVVGILVLAWPLAVGASRPATGVGRDRDADRRARYVARNPHEVSVADIRVLLTAGGLDDAQVEFVTARAHDLGIKPFTMLVWLKRFDATALATVIAADLSQHDLIAHISEGTVPNLAELSVFAELNGFSTVAAPAKTQDAKGPAAQRSARPIPPPRVITAPAQQPSITNPENWAMDQGSPVTLESLGLYDLPVTDDGDENHSAA